MAKSSPSSVSSLWCLVCLQLCAPDDNGNDNGDDDDDVKRCKLHVHCVLKVSAAGRSQIFPCKKLHICIHRYIYMYVCTYYIAQTCFPTNCHFRFSKRRSIVSAPLLPPVFSAPQSMLHNLLTLLVTGFVLMSSLLRKILRHREGTCIECNKLGFIASLFKLTTFIQSSTHATCFKKCVLLLVKFFKLIKIFLKITFIVVYLLGN